MWNARCSAQGLQELQFRIAKKRESELGNGAAEFIEPISSASDDSRIVIPDENVAEEELIELAALITVPKNDKRPHLNVEINGYVIGGLLDSGANITILGRGNDELIKSLMSQAPMSKQLSIRTADGTIHHTRAVINVPYTANGATKMVSTLIIPTITTQLILGTDFWEAFNIRPMFCCAVDSDGDSEQPPKFDPVNVKHELTIEQELQLAEVVSTFEGAPSEGLLGCTDRTEHVIDTGEAKPINVYSTGRHRRNKSNASKRYHTEN